MPYNLNKTNGELFLTIADGTLNTSTSLYFIGRNYPSYGEFQQENFLRLLESNANSTPPAAPIKGQLWYDTAEGVLKVYDGTRFKAQANLVISGSSNNNYRAPGDLWWDTTNLQLKAWNGTSYSIIGPLWSDPFGNSGPIVTTLYNQDANPVNRTPRRVVINYVDNRITSIENPGEAFTPNVAIPGFQFVPRGISANTSATAPFSIEPNNGNILLKNNNLNSNINFQVNVASTTVTAIRINGATGLATVVGDPINNLGIATKQYVDVLGTISNAKIDSANVSTQANISLLNSNIATANARLALIEANIIAANLDIDFLFANTLESASNIRLINSNVSAANITIQNISANLGAYQIYANANAAFQHRALANLESNIGANITTSINTIANLLAFKANIDSPTFTGDPRSVTFPTSTANTSIATTEFVQEAVNFLQQPYRYVQIFNALSTYTDQLWTVPDYVTSAKFTITGGGGAGSGSASPNVPGVGGGAGATTIAWVQVRPGEQYRIRVGRGGQTVASSNPGNPGGNGETTFVVKNLPTPGANIIASGGGGGNRIATDFLYPGIGGGSPLPTNTYIYTPISISAITADQTISYADPNSLLLDVLYTGGWRTVSNPTLPVRIIMNLATAVRVNSYRLYNVATSNPSQATPYSWVFEGKNLNQSTWTLLDTVNDAPDYYTSLPAGTNSVSIQNARYYEAIIPSTQVFQQYSIRFTQLAGRNEAGAIHLSAVRLFDAALATAQPAYPITGNLNIAGGPGYIGGVNNSIPVAGSGGNSFWGGGATPPFRGLAGVAGNNYGAGGSGGSQPNLSNNPVRGGPGGPGIVMIEY